MLGIEREVEVRAALRGDVQPFCRHQALEDRRVARREVGGQHVQRGGEETLAGADGAEYARALVLRDDGSEEASMRHRIPLKAQDYEVAIERGRVGKDRGQPGEE